MPLVLLLALLGTACAEMPPPVTQLADAPPREASSPRAACLAATREAEITHGLPEGLLTAIALNESGLHAYALICVAAPISRKHAKKRAGC
jgi:hypothetical protein